MNKKMKKVVFGMIVGAATLSIGTSVLFAAETSGGNNYVDVNQDGICDYLQDTSAVMQSAISNCNQPSSGYTDNDQDGICDNYGTGNNYVDEDQDGICDHFQQNSARGQAGSPGAGRGQGYQYTDEDQDGICDHYASRPLDGSGNQYRRGRN